MRTEEENEPSDWLNFGRVIGIEVILRGRRMNIVLEMCDTHQDRELSITDGTVTLNTKNGFMLGEEDLHNWITRAFDTWLTLKENQKRVEERRDG